MKYNCKRCKGHGEFRAGAATGNNAARYATLKKQINQSRILTLDRLPMPNNLCMPCMEELIAWLKNANPVRTV
jgi:hypothetical protein